MGAIEGRRRRDENAPTVLLQGRVSPTSREEVRDAAARSGVSLAYYLDTLIQDLVRENGQLPAVAQPRERAAELDIPEEARTTAA